ncbi:LysR family transcriptional regulator [Pantoea sp. Bo_2]|uniref:LysR family transcriptional regulator n=1 Tax=Candidatus Pantoea gossypiicola TaxID=2608008 RepID=A0AB34CGT4_9GAMM|nr:MULTISPECIES: LysR family transcriptional regulator [Pantoea]KAA5927749.1 LysR family transcriptional regulator [Pantoea sp. VH_8]KAA5932479.1 LysR family transcriptional regulator [Pantoea sp. VH_4]KAA5942227.1 LysR family transcriptional regulator [Pantoea sp. VH_3]KAA5950196.1 LysR family transcriptional regulator [Pantoea sp. VH_25]KAA5955897.1 LysR family transcriptional regulator [Pantoea sp. VH_16]
MDINQLRCFVVLGDELHFGRAARKLEMMPASLSRFIRLLEDDLGIRLLNRSTRNVSLTPEGAAFLNEAKTVLADFDGLRLRFLKNRLTQKRTLRIGAIDSAARGLLPKLINLFVRQFPEADIHITEDKSHTLIPRLLSGWLDVVLIRPPEQVDAMLTTRFIANETCVLAVPAHHRLVNYSEVTIRDFCHEPVIMPERRTRPHSHDLTMNVFKAGGCTPVIAQYAEEKQTILSFVAAGLGIALVPSSYKNMNADGVKYLTLSPAIDIEGLPLSAMWHQGNNNLYVRALLDMLADNLDALTRDL